MKWAIVIEKSANGYGGYAPDLPGLGVVGDSPEEVRRLLAEGIAVYLEESAADRDRPLHPEAEVGFIETPA